VLYTASEWSTLTSNVLWKYNTCSPAFYPDFVRLGTRLGTSGEPLMDAPNESNNAIVPLNHLMLEDCSWDDFDGDLLHELLKEGGGGDAVSLDLCAPKAILSDAAGSKSHVSSDGSRQMGNDCGARNKRVRSDDCPEEKLEKLRSRNRIAQASRRRRQRVRHHNFLIVALCLQRTDSVVQQVLKCNRIHTVHTLFDVQEEIEILERKIVQTKDRILAAQSHCREYREQKVSMFQRFTKAEQTLLAAAREAAAQEASHLPPTTLQVQQLSPVNSLFPRRHTDECQASLRSRPIDSFPVHRPLFVESCMQSISSSPAALPSFSNILSTHKNASLMPQPSVPASDTCWFLQTIHTVPSGAALSVSSSLSSLQCCVTLLFHYMLNQLECGLVDQEISCYNGHITEGATPNLQPATVSCPHCHSVEHASRVTLPAILSIAM
jgi:hypothetical protein